jgi:hypothetical protein
MRARLRFWLAAAAICGCGTLHSPAHEADDPKDTHAGGSHWAQPDPPKWPDYVGTDDLLASGTLKTAYVLLEEIEVLAGAEPDPASPEGKAKAAAGMRKTKRFAEKIGPAAFLPFTDNEGWALVVVAFRQAQGGYWQGCYETLQNEKIPYDAAPADVYLWGDNLDADWDCNPPSDWSQHPAPPATEDARYYVTWLDLNKGSADPLHRTAIDHRINDQAPLPPGVKHLVNNATKNPSRWARVLAAYYAGKAGNWALCRNELEHCD